MTAQAPIQEPRHEIHPDAFRGIDERLNRNHVEFQATLNAMQGASVEEQLRLARRLHDLCDQWDSILREAWR